MYRPKSPARPLALCGSRLRPTPTGIFTHLGEITVPEALAEELRQSLNLAYAHHFIERPVHGVRIGLRSQLTLRRFQQRSIYHKTYALHVHDIRHYLSIHAGLDQGDAPFSPQARTRQVVWPLARS